MVTVTISICLPHRFGVAFAQRKRTHAFQQFHSVHILYLFYFKTGLDSTYIPKMAKLMHGWLTNPSTEMMFWRTTYELIAKNYYVDVDTELEGSEEEKAKEKRIIADMLEKGSFQLRICQRTDLFKVNFSSFL